MPNPPPVKVTFSGVDKLSRVLNKVGAKFSKFGKNTGLIGRNFTTKLSLPLALMGGFAIKAGADFESSMLNVQALTNGTGKQFEQMKNQAKDLGATTMFTAGQAGDAMGFLAMAGFDTNKILKATPGILNLAAAGNLELAEAADLASNVLTAFKLPAEDITRVNQALAHTAANSNTNIQQMGEAMKFVAPVAAGLGISIEETSAAIGLLGNAGIQATMAGTTLRRSMSALVAPTGEAVSVLNKLKIKRADILDSAGNLKSLTAVVEALEKSSAGAGDMMKLFGQRAGPGMLALVGQGSKALKDLNNEIGEKGAASLARLAAARMAGFNGALKTLKSALEAVAISIAESGVLDFLTKMAKKLADVFRNLSKANPAILRIGFVVVAAAAAIGPLLMFIGFMAQGLGALMTAAKLVLLPLKIFNFLLAANPIGAIILGIALLTVGIVLLIKNWDKVVSKFKAGFNILKKVGGFFAGGPKTAEEMAFVPPETGAAAEGHRIQDIRQENTTKGQADVNIKFSNMPAGTRVDTDNKGVNLNQDTGFARGQ